MIYSSFDHNLKFTIRFLKSEKQQIKKADIYKSLFRLCDVFIKKLNQSFSILNILPYYTLFL